MRCFIRVRMSAQDTHYGGHLVDGAKVLQLFGDACTELCIRHDGDEGLLRTYRDVEFLAPVYSGDYLEVQGKLTRVGRTSRNMELTAHKVIAAHDEGESAACVLDKPILVCRATAVCVVPLEKQRRHRADQG